MQHSASKCLAHFRVKGSDPQMLVPSEFILKNGMGTSEEGLIVGTNS